MLFEDYRLKSKYDFDQELPDELSDLSSLAKEIQRITELIQLQISEEGSVWFHHRDIHEKIVTIDQNAVSDKTWNRSELEIREILYRSEKANGQDRQQFSLSKNLKIFNIYEPDDEKQYKHYLQLLYFFYMMNYFAFPRVNIFKKLAMNNLDYKNTYDEGADNGEYLIFIITHILDNSQVLSQFMYENCLLTKILEHMSKQMLFLTSQSHQPYQLYQHILKKIETIPSAHQPTKTHVLNQMVAYCHQYTMLSYATDLLNNLANNQQLLTFEELDIPPFSNWQKRYIQLDKLDDFLKENQLYWFCKQNLSKIESRERIKFLNSNAVLFLKQFIEYDQNWMQLFEEDDGLCLEKTEQGYKIYALKIALIIKTYNDLINKKKIRIKNGKKEQPLRTILSVSLMPKTILWTTLALRIFLLVCHLQYFYATMNKNEAQTCAIKELILPEKLLLKSVQIAFQNQCFDEWYHYFTQCVQILNKMIDNLETDN